MSIPAERFTNLDVYGREEWPTEFAALPRPGDWVKAESGKVLTVVKVTHAMRWIGNNRVEKRPYIKVELHR